jgi:hypothetical protein
VTTVTTLMTALLPSPGTLNLLVFSAADLVGVVAAGAAGATGVTGVTGVTGERQPISIRPASSRGKPGL